VVQAHPDIMLNANLALCLTLPLVDLFTFSDQSDHIVKGNLVFNEKITSIVMLLNTSVLTRRYVVRPDNPLASTRQDRHLMR
jgi:hypothetical protein